MKDDIVERIRERFPRPVYCDDGLMTNESADEIERLREIVDLKQATIIGLERRVENQGTTLRKWNKSRSGLKSAEQRLRNMGYAPGREKADD